MPLENCMVTPPRTPVETPDKEPSAELQKKTTIQNLSDWMPRDAAARLLGLAVQTIIAYEKRGLLHPLHDKRRDSRGREHTVTVIDPQELLALRKKLNSKEVKPDGSIDTSSWYTRNEACDSMSISIQTLKNYEARGLIHPLKAARVDPLGRQQMVIVYDPDELSRVARGAGRLFSPRTSGESEAKCYALIEEGKTNREIVVAMRETSERVRELRERWENDGGADLIVTTEAKKALEALVGPFNDVTGLVQLVTAALKPSEAKAVAEPEAGSPG